MGDELARELRDRRVGGEVMATYDRMSEFYAEYMKQSGAVVVHRQMRIKRAKRQQANPLAGELAPLIKEREEQRHAAHKDHHDKGIGVYSWCPICSELG